MSRATGRTHRGTGLVLVLLVGSLAILSTAPGSLGRPEASSRGFTISAGPTTGPAPLLVKFSVNDPNGTPPELHWAFGDGRYLNGTGASFETPTHLYVSPGLYECVVTAIWVTGSLNASVAIDVHPAAPVVNITATPSGGPAPLTVWLNASVSGGTGTYLSTLWSFGDGGSGTGLSLRYTYASAGRFSAQLAVTDSANRTGVGLAVVDVGNGSAPTGAAPSASRAAPRNLLTEPRVDLALSVGFAGVIGSILWVRRSRRRAASSGSAVALDGTAPPGHPVPDGPRLSDPPGPSIGAARPGVEVLAPRGPEPPARARAEAPVGDPGLPPSVTLSTSLTQLILRHLAGQPRDPWKAEAATRASTQAGIAESVGGGQSAVSRILRRLVAAGVMTVETRHVAGSARRMKVYVLTERGERLGRALRPGETPRPEPPGPGSTTR